MRIKRVEPGQRPMSADVGGGFGMGNRIKKQLMILGGLAILVGLAMWMWLGGDDAEAKKPTPAPVKIQTVAPLPSPNPAGPTWTPTTPLEPAQIAATATAHALYSRPAQINPATMPFLIGVITYEPGCAVSNLGFTTAGLEGRPYYLFFSTPLDRDPLMQMVNVSGYIQQFDDCQHPVLMVQQIYWLADQATPAPLGVNYLPITRTLTGTVTAAVPPAWGNLPTPDKHATPIYNPPAWTPTIYPTYTPFPTATPYVPPAPRVTIIYRDVDDDDDPTSTPTRTPTPTTTATPIVVSIYGDVVTVIGCPYTNLAISDGQNNYYIEMAGAQLPAGNPADYWGMVSGQASTICDGNSIKASQIIWYDPPEATETPTATSTATFTPTATEIATETPTMTPTATITATEVITQ